MVSNVSVTCRSTNNRVERPLFDLMNSHCRDVILFGWIDPSSIRQLGWLRRIALESHQVCLESCMQGLGALAQQDFCLAVVDRLWRHEDNTGMAMFTVLPSEELLAVGSCILDTAESRGKLGSVFQGFELRLATKAATPRFEEC